MGRQFSSLVLAFIPFACLIFFVVKYTVDVPYWDQWEFVPLLAKSYQGALSFNDFWTQHNVHRLFFPKIIMIFLARFTAWNIYYELAVNIFLAIGIFLAINYQTRLTMKSIGNYGTNWLIPIISMMVFSLSQWENWSWGWQIQIFLNIFAVVTGIILLAKPVFKWVNFIAALLLGIVATYSFANGIIYWLIGLLILYFNSFNKLNPKKLSMVLWMVAGFIVVYLFFHNHTSSNLSLFFNLLRVEYIRYVFVYLGAPLIGFSTRLDFHNLAFLVGLLGLVILSYLSWLLIRARNIKLQVLVPYISLSLYSIASAFMTGIGRVDLGSLQAMASRYVTIGQLFWISIVVFLYLLINNNFKLNHHKKNRFRKRVLFSALSVIILLIVFNSARGGRCFFWRYHTFLHARAALLSVKNDDPNSDSLKHIFPSEDVVKKRAEILRKHHLSLFRGRTR